jgi:general secretion pathway protein D
MNAIRIPCRSALSLLLGALLVFGAQQKHPPPPPGLGPRAAPPPAAEPKAVPQPQQPSPQTQPAKPAPGPAEPPKPAPTEQAPVTLTPAPSGGMVLNLQNASLVEVIDILARRLRINYILDPRVKGTVTLNTYGELKEVDIRALLDLILRINGFAMVQVGEIHRIVPLPELSRQPLPPAIDPKSVPENEQMALNLVFLKYAAVADMAKLLDKFLGEGATMITYEPANLLLLLDNNRNMRRTMELIALFDSDVLVSQRVRLFEVQHGRPSDVAKELETVLRGVSLGEKAGAVRFLPVDRINTIIAVAPNPGVFDQVEAWLKKLDVPAKVTAGTTQNYVYRVKYGRAETLAAAIMQLYLGYFGFGFGYGGFGGFGGFGAPAGYPGYFGAGTISPYGAYGAFPGGISPGFGVPGAYGPTPYGPGYGIAPTPGAVPRTGAAPPVGQQSEAGAAGQQAPRTAGTPFDLTGSYLGAGYGYGWPLPEGFPRVVPNPLDNSLLIQATPQEYEKILNLLKELDVPPRQVLIEAKIYEVSLTGAFAGGVSAFLQKRGGSGTGSPSLATNLLQGTSSVSGLTLTAGTLVGQTRELLAFLTAQEDTRRAKVVSAPSVIATDSIPASITVGQEVPTLTSQAVTGAQVGGSSLFANTIQNRTSGVTLNILAHVNPSGIVTLVINQEVSAPVPPSANAAIQSPSFTKRTVQTQVTVQDGDTIAIGGIIQESDTSSSAGVPILHRIPILGAAFGAKSTSKERTELIVFMTPRVIYDTNMITDASEELKSKLRRLQKLIRE